MPGQSKQIGKAAKRLREDHSPATPPRMPGIPVIRNEMTDKRFNESRTQMMDPDEFMGMREHMRKNPDGERSASVEIATRLAELLLRPRRRA